jgi:hypothetical protein
MLQLILEIKNSPDYKNRFSENTKINFDLYERALCGDAEALIDLSYSKQNMDNIKHLDKD